PHRDMARNPYRSHSNALRESGAFPTAAAGSSKTALRRRTSRSTEDVPRRSGSRLSPGEGACGESGVHAGMVKYSLAIPAKAGTMVPQLPSPHAIAITYG